MSRITTTDATTNPAEVPAKSSILGDLWASVAVTGVLGAICCGAYPLIVWGIAQGVFPHQANGSLLKRDGTPAKNDQEAGIVGSALLGQSFTAAGYFHPRPSAANNSAGSSFSSTGGYDPTGSGGTNFGPLSDELINGLVNAPPATQPTTQPAVAGAATAPTTAPAPTLAFDGVRLRTIHYAVDNGLSFKLLTGRADATVGSYTTEVPLKKYQDASGNLNDVALVTDFPHPQSDAPDRAVVVARDFRAADGKPVEIPADAVTASGSGLDPHISPDNAAFQAQRVADARKAPVDQVKAMIDQYTDKPDLGILGDPGVNVLRLNLALDAKYPLPAPPATQPTTQPAK